MVDKINNLRKDLSNELDYEQLIREEKKIDFEKEIN